MKKLLLLIIFITTVEASQAQYALGEKIYKQTCLSCHAKNGNADTAFELVVKPRKLTKSILTQEQSFQIIKEGAHAYGAHADIMPTFKYVYSDVELQAVSHYISLAFNSKRDSKVQKLLDNSAKLSKEDRENMLKVGEKIFTRNCAKCHGNNGNGQSEYVQQSKSNDNFIYLYNLQKILLNQDQIFLYVKFGGNFWGADKNDMPAWKKKYNDTQLKSVAYYVATQIKKSNKENK